MIILHRLGTLMTEFADYLAKTRTAVELSQLSQSQLEDLGITRGQLNASVRDLWVNNDAAVAKTVKTEKTNKASDTGFDFGRYIAAMYSSQNRTGYMV